MKKKRIFGFLAVIICQCMMLGSCKVEESIHLSQETEKNVLSGVSAYPADMRFAEYAKLIFSDKQENDAESVFNTNQSDIKVFRYESTDMASGVAFHHIQVQMEDEDGVTVFTGTMWPEGMEWESTDQAAGEQSIQAEAVEETVVSEEALEQAELKKKLGDTLLADVQWISCIQAGVYANNQKMTMCMVSGQNVIYTDEEHTVFQVQSYNEEGKLYSVSEVSKSSAKDLLNGTIDQTLWSTDLNPLMGQPAQEIIETQEADEAPKEDGINIWMIVLIAVLLLSTAAVLAYVLYQKKSKSRQLQQAPGTDGKVKSIGTVHNIGSRSGQQDSFDVVQCDAGMLAVVADGMGGLSDGDKVSQKIVSTMRNDAAHIRAGQTDNILCQMVAHVNQEINKMLGLSNQYKCGSTLLAVLVENHMMQWISVGDSRIYLYRGGSLIQINREHIFCAELLERAINGKKSFGDVMRDPQVNRLNSFIGMGELKRVDICLNKLKLCEGDRILLMSDGVFNTLSNEEIADIIRSAADAVMAAAHLEQRVLQRNAPKQDNFTCVILEI